MTTLNHDATTMTIRKSDIPAYAEIFHYRRNDKNNNNIYSTVLQSNGVEIFLVVTHDTFLTDDITRFGMTASISLLRHHTTQMYFTIDGGAQFLVNVEK